MVPLCAMPRCPLVERFSGFAPKPTGLDLFGASPPAVFVGRHGYPRVNLGPLVPPGASVDARLDDPAALADLDIATILGMRAGLVRSKSPVDVRMGADPTHALEVSQALAIATRPVDTELRLSKPLPLDRVAPRLDATNAPMGPSVDVVRARLTENAPVARKVDALVSDVHADAATALWEMYEGGVGLGQMQRVLSVGLLGEAKRRRLVPTRWSITATDDQIGLRLLDEIRSYPEIDTITLHEATLFGNRFLVAFLPRPWCFEMVEAWREDGAWGFGSDREGFHGRTAYAENVAGGYYAARLPTIEHLHARRRQAAVFLHREITEDYWAPLGVWVVREGARRAVESKPLPFEDVPSLIRHLERHARGPGWMGHAKLLREAATQKRLSDF